MSGIGFLSLIYEVVCQHVPYAVVLGADEALQELKTHSFITYVIYRQLFFEISIKVIKEVNTSRA